MTAKFPQEHEADILLLSEGAYPYITGGVSSWIQTLMTTLPELRFAVVFLGSRPEDYEKIHYDFPPNLVHFQEHYLFSAPDSQAQKLKDDMSIEQQDALDTLHQQFKQPNALNQNAVELISQLIDPETGITETQFHHGHCAWEFITEQFEAHSTDPSFIDYFWTVKNMHLPIWQLAKIPKQLPRAKLIHSISTGYAGFLGVLIKQYQKIPLVLTEHGIYTKERKIELLRSSIVHELTTLSRTQNIDYLRNLWIHFFEVLGLLCYKKSSEISALFYAASKRQEQDGADPKKQCVIPNGVNISHLKQFRHQPSRQKKRLCLLGRVVPIKDIKTFIRAIKSLTKKTLAFDVTIVGPMDEDEQYAKECQQLTKSLGLEKHISFRGKMPLDEVLPQTDMMILSSISEGMPLVLLEGFAAGIPAVTTNVGSCEELIHGATESDRALGSAGRLVKIADPSELANNIFELLDDTNWQEASQNAIKRVETFYNLDMMVDAYREFYKRNMK